jgi:NADH-quinone oxidoreductase subunit H
MPRDALRRTSTLLALAAIGLGCETQPTHEVISLTDLTPRQVEVGDRVIVQGSGFPLAADIRRVSLRLSGVLSRPGLPQCPRPVTLNLSDPAETGSVIDPITGVEHESIYAAASIHTLRVEGGNRIEFTVTEEVLKALTTCPGERAHAVAPHATVALAGPRAGVSIEVETMQGTTLASGRALRGPRIDVLSPWGRTLDSERTARIEAERALAFMGLRLAAVHPPEGGLQIERVAPGSPGDEAGLVDGDVVERLDGATLLGVSDFRPSPGVELAVISVRRGDAVEDRPVHVGALTRGVPLDVVATAVTLLAALAVVAFGMSPRRGLLGWASARFAPTFATHPRSAATSRWTRFTEALRGRLMGDPERTALTFAAVATTSLAVPFGQAIFALDPDVSLAHLVNLLAAVTLSALTARAVSPKPTMALTARAVGRRLLMELPALCAVVATVLLSGELRVVGVMTAQGGAPWAWNLFRNPALLALGVAHLGSLMMFAPEARASSSRVLRGASWALVVARAALASVLLLGGARVPGVELSSQETAVGFQMLGALLLMAKTWGLVAGARTLIPRVGAAHPTLLTTVSLRYLVPLGVIGVTLVAAWEPIARALPPSAWELAVLVSSLATFAACATGVGVMLPSTQRAR